MHVVSFIKKGLSESGYEVSAAFDGSRGLHMALNHSFDLILLDIMLPEMNGLDVCKAIRQEKNTVPILLLTALGTSENLVIGLESGADDYLVKPFKFIELEARIKSLLRRTHMNQSAMAKEEEAHTYRFADLRVNDYTKSVIRGDVQISLTTTEYKLLLQLIKQPRKVLSRGDLLESVWGVDFDVGTNVVDVYVNYLRKKIDAPFDQKLIYTVVGMGYVMRDHE